MTNPLLHKHAEELRAMWQSRALAASGGKLRAVLTVVLAKEYAAAFPVLWRVTFGNQDVPDTFISGYASVMPSGKVVAGVMNGGAEYQVAIYDSKEEFTFAMRRLADRLKLRDSERIEFFGVLSKWIVADLRVGVNGERLAS